MIRLLLMFLCLCFGTLSAEDSAPPISIEALDKKIAMKQMEIKENERRADKYMWANDFTSYRAAEAKADIARQQLNDLKEQRAQLLQQNQ